MKDKVLKLFKSYFSLTFIRTCFTDQISGKTVSAYIDCYGDEWLKDGRWSLFRVYNGNVIQPDTKEDE
jgi:hypothetical protein